MDALLQVLVSGLLMGSIYAASAVGLSLVWGALGMLNMAHGIMLTMGGYISFSTVMHMGLPSWLGLPIACVISALVGLLIYFFHREVDVQKPCFSNKRYCRYAWAFLDAGKRN